MCEVKEERVVSVIYEPRSSLSLPENLYNSRFKILINYRGNNLFNGKEMLGNVESKLGKGKEVGINWEKLKKKDGNGISDEG